MADASPSPVLRFDDPALIDHLLTGGPAARVAARLVASSVIPDINAFVQAEQARGSPQVEILLALAGVLASTMGSMVASLAVRGSSANAADLLATTMREALLASARSVEAFLRRQRAEATHG